MHQLVHVLYAVILFQIQKLNQQLIPKENGGKKFLQIIILQSTQII